MHDQIQPVGRVTHYYGRISVAVIELDDRLTLGDWVHFYGFTTNFVQPVESMQYDREPIGEAFADDVIAVQVEGRVREGDLVYPYLPDELS